MFWIEGEERGGEAMEETILEDRAADSHTPRLQAEEISDVDISK